MSVLKEYIEATKGLLATRDACKFNFGGVPNILKSVSPQFRMFLDSELNSPIEGAVKKIWADSIVTNLQQKFPSWEFSQNVAASLGNWIGEKTNNFMDRMKVFHQYHQGMISLDQYLDQRSTQLQATLVNVVHQSKKVSWIARQYLREYLPDADNFIEKVAQGTGLRTGINWVVKGVEKVVSSEKTKELLEASIVTTHKAITGLSNAYKAAKEKVVEPVIEKIAEVAQTTAEVVVDVAKATADYAKSAWKTTKENAKKLWRWITG